jgi:hypothetical protein
MPGVDRARLANLRAAGGEAVSGAVQKTTSLTMADPKMPNDSRLALPEVHEKAIPGFDAD